MTSRSEWGAPTTTDIVHRRAAGRAHYNSVRKLVADQRAVEIFKRLVAYNFTRGAQARVAREFGVSRSTVSRVLDRLPRPPNQIRCPLCGAVPLDDL